jgi:hypothetical protein
MTAYDCFQDNFKMFNVTPKPIERGCLQESGRLKKNFRFEIFSVETIQTKIHY